jgi:hypothetical protein
VLVVLERLEPGRLTGFIEPAPLKAIRERERGRG